MPSEQPSAGNTQKEYEAAFEDYVASSPLPPEHEWDGTECPNCGEPWDLEEWDERHVAGGPSIGEDWYYTCPGCGKETFEVGT